MSILDIYAGNLERYYEIKQEIDSASGRYISPKKDSYDFSSLIRAVKSK